MQTSFYSRDDLVELGFKTIGENVLISKKASIYTASQISIASNVRIDDFCILSGEINIGNFVHISAYAALYAPVLIEIADFCGLSPRVTIFSGSDDFSADCLINPMIPSAMRRVIQATIRLERCVQIGTGSVVLPGVVIGEGSTIGALSLVKKNLAPWGVYAGNPIRKIKDRPHSKIDQYLRDMEKI
jgi:galactoside O-acetyltransferase